MQEGDVRPRGYNSRDLDTRPLLAVSNLLVRFGGITALDGISFEVAPGEICGLIGPNGAGKTTVFNCVSRLYEPVSGDLLLDGTSLLGLRPHEVVARGVARTFQNLALFERLTVLENVLVGGHATGAPRNTTHAAGTTGSADAPDRVPDRHRRPGVFRGGLADALGTRAAREGERRLRARAREWLAFVGLADQADARVGDLPFGSRKRLELARALLAEPRLLLLDEPAGGLTLEEVERVDRLVRDVRDRLGITILLVEHRMGLVMSICDRLVVLNFGRVLAEGPPAAIADDPAVVEAYLGSRA